jgi:hypothetical protein
LFIAMIAAAGATPCGVTIALDRQEKAVENGVESVKVVAWDKTEAEIRPQLLRLHVVLVDARHHAGGLRDGCHRDEQRANDLPARQLLTSFSRAGDAQQAAVERNDAPPTVLDLDEQHADDVPRRVRAAAQVQVQLRQLLDALHSELLEQVDDARQVVDEVERAALVERCDDEPGVRVGERCDRLHGERQVSSVAPPPATRADKQASKQASKWRSPFRRLWCPSLARAIGRADLGATGTTG